MKHLFEFLKSLDGELIVILSLWSLFMAAGMGFFVLVLVHGPGLLK